MKQILAFALILAVCVFAGPSRKRRQINDENLPDDAGQEELAEDEPTSSDSDSSPDITQQVAEENEPISPDSDSSPDKIQQEAVENKPISPEFDSSSSAPQEEAVENEPVSSDSDSNPDVIQQEAVENEPSVSLDSNSSPNAPQEEAVENEPISRNSDSSFNENANEAVSENNIADVIPSVANSHLPEKRGKINVPNVKNLQDPAQKLNHLKPTAAEKKQNSPIGAGTQVLQQELNSLKASEKKLTNNVNALKSEVDHLKNSAPAIANGHVDKEGGKVATSAVGGLKGTNRHEGQLKQQAAMKKYNFLKGSEAEAFQEEFEDSKAPEELLNEKNSLRSDIDKLKKSKALEEKKFNAFKAVEDREIEKDENYIGALKSRIESLEKNLKTEELAHPNAKKGNLDGSKVSKPADSEKPSVANENLKSSEKSTSVPVSTTSRSFKQKIVGSLEKAQSLMNTTTDLVKPLLSLAKPIGSIVSLAAVMG